jgi:hypothetical protein
MARGRVRQLVVRGSRIQQRGTAAQTWLLWNDKRQRSAILAGGALHSHPMGASPMLAPSMVQFTKGKRPFDQASSVKTWPRFNCESLSDTIANRGTVMP